MYSDICMCVLYTYAAVKRFLIWCAGPDESNGIFLLFFYPDSATVLFSFLFVVYIKIHQLGLQHMIV